MSDYHCRNECSNASVPSTGCIGKSGTQCVDISQPIVLTPTASLGTVVSSCPGTPTVTCVTAADGTACTVTLTQRLCISIPISYGVEIAPGDPSIVCADGAASCGC